MREITVDEIAEKVKDLCIDAGYNLPADTVRALEDFRDTLAKTFQVELGSVLNSFDNSVGAVLHQMKSEMQIGISRVESIEGMVRSRQAAGRSLLGAADQLELPDALDQEEEEEAEQLVAEKDAGDDLDAAAVADAEPTDEPEQADEGEESEEGIERVLVETAPDVEGDKSHYPSEMGTLDEEDLFLPDDDQEE